MKIQCHWIFKDPLQESQNHFNIGLKITGVLNHQCLLSFLGLLNRQTYMISGGVFAEVRCKNTLIWGGGIQLVS